MARPDSDGVDWSAVAARALAFQALQQSDIADKGLVEKAKFLMLLGLSRSEAAGLLGSTDDSLRVSMARVAKRPVGSKAAPGV